jgi:hypothetical protein
MQWDTNSDTGVHRTIAKLDAWVLDVSNGVESGFLQVQTSDAGTLTTKMSWDSNSISTYYPIYGSSAASWQPYWGLMNTNADESSGVLSFVKLSASPAVNDYLGSIWFNSNNSAAEWTRFAAIEVNSTGVTDGSEESMFVFTLMKAGAYGEVFRIEGDQVLMTNVYQMEMTNAATDCPGIYLVNTNADNSCSWIDFYKDSASPAVNDYLGGLFFDGNDSADNVHSFAIIRSLALNVTNGAEEGSFVFYLMKAGAAAAEVLRFTSAGITMADATNIALNTTTGTKIGTATTQKLAFHNAAPCVQAAHIANPASTAAACATAIAAILVVLENKGLTAAA